MKSEMTTTTNFAPISINSQPLTVEGLSTGSHGNHDYSYFLKDHLGSTRMVLAQDGTVKEALMYQPYGAVSNVESIGATATDPLRQKFTTKEFDEEGVLEDEAKIYTKVSIAIPSDKYTATITTMQNGTIPYNSNLTIWQDPNGNYHVISGHITGGLSTDFYSSIEIQITNTETNQTYTYTLNNLNWTYQQGYQKTYTLDRSLTDIQTAISAGTNLFVESKSFLGNSRINAYHFGARLYDPDLGIWNSPDPKEEFFNLYSYVGGNPLKFIDPNGKEHDITDEEKKWREDNNLCDPDIEQDAPTDKYYGMDQDGKFFEINKDTYYRGFNTETYTWEANLYSYNGKPVAMYFPYERGGVTNCVGYALFGSGEFQPSWDATMNEALAGVGFNSIDLKYGELKPEIKNEKDLLIYLYHKDNVDLSQKLTNEISKYGAMNIKLENFFKSGNADFHGLRPTSEKNVYTFVERRWTQNLLRLNGLSDVPIKSTNLNGTTDAFSEDEFLGKAYYYKR